MGCCVSSDKHVPLIQEPIVPAPSPVSTQARPTSFPGPAVLSVIERQYPGMRASVQANINAMTPQHRRILARTYNL